MIDGVLFIVIIMIHLLGGCWIAMAVNNFKRERYFLFGVDLLAIVYLMMCLFKIYFNV